MEDLSLNNLHQVNRATDIIERLDLRVHDEGGFYHQLHHVNGTQESPLSLTHDGLTYSVIYYMLTAESPIGYLHMNQSDILHFFHYGWPLTYLLIDDGGRLERKVLGPDIQNGQELQMLVTGGTWKATVLEEGEYGLLSEVALPAFDRQDREFATVTRIQQLFPHLQSDLVPYLRTEKTPLKKQHRS